MLAAPFLVLAAAQTAPAASPAAPEVEAESEIVVVGSGKREYRLSADQLRDAVRTFEAQREQYAPGARLAWRFRPAGAGDGIDLALTDGTESIAIPRGADGYFTLPHERILHGNFRLVTGARRGTLRIQPIALSPGSSVDNLRVGDARLTCRVYWSFIDNEASIFAKALFPAIGGCGSSRIGFYFGADSPITSVSVTHSARPVDVTKDHMAYRLPIADKTVGNEERIIVTH